MKKKTLSKDKAKRRRKKIPKVKISTMQEEKNKIKSN